MAILKTRKKGSGGARPGSGRKYRGEKKNPATFRAYPSDLALIKKRFGSLQKGFDYFVDQIKKENEQAT